MQDVCIELQRDHRPLDPFEKHSIKLAPVITAACPHGNCPELCLRRQASITGGSTIIQAFTNLGMLTSTEHCAHNWPGNKLFSSSAGLTASQQKNIALSVVQAGTADNRTPQNVERDLSLTGGTSPQDLAVLDSACLCVVNVIQTLYSATAVTKDHHEPQQN